ncbi:MAG: hypothetical protein HYS40_04725 [Gemmatimonadetes bacterium]|nr:hypothetical protein [Gemmatimonadota bacterium]
MELVLAHATRVKAIAAAKVKTDQVDADTLALLLPNDDVQPLLWIPGLGKVNAFTIYIEVDGIQRFPSARSGRSSRPRPARSRSGSRARWWPWSWRESSMKS